MGEELGRIQRETGVTAILVSHSRQEISRLCTESLELAEGRIPGAGPEMVARQTVSRRESALRPGHKSQ